MVFTQDQTLYGFRVTSVRDSAELNGSMVRMVHLKTGAELFFLGNGAENMVFSITFRTIPEDSTGVFHILEHSVLCGSRKYPVREPFVELLKGSMSTFLNAMTFSDMTMYPVSSRNPRDLMNLTGVYLDAVFDPLVMRDPKRFAQEGWHIDWDERGEPVYRGVVFNEMKGAMSDTDTLIDRQIMRQLFPDTSYGFNSGGDPEEIPSLTYARFQQMYRRHYHPSNARVYLDGAVPMGEMLPLLDSYLSRYDRLEILPEYAFQTPKSSERTIFYELSQEEDEANRGHLTLARLVGSWRDRAHNMAMSIIGDVLTGNNEAPLKRLALERDLAQDLNLEVDDSALQSWVTIHAENVTDGREGEIRSLIREMGQRIQQEGLDRDAVEASLNRAIYHLREEEEPQGIGRCIRAAGSWIFGGDPGEALLNEPLIAQLRAMLDSGEFDRLAAEMLLEETGLVVLHSRPSKTLGAEKRAAESRRLHAIVDGWTEAERQANDRLIRDLELWQQTPDSEEDLKTLPMLRKEDADVAPFWVATKESLQLGVPTLLHRLPTSGVVHLRAYFTLTDLSLPDLTAVTQLTSLLGRLPTAKYDAFRLQQEIKRYTGALGFSVAVRSRPGEDDVCTPVLVAYVSALRENMDKALELLAEILTETRFDQPDRILEIIQQNELSARQRIVAAGHLIAVKHVLSRYSAENAVKNALDGDPAVRYIHRFAKQPNQVLPSFLALARRVMASSVSRARMTVSVTAEDAQALSPLLSPIPQGAPVPPSAAYRNEAPARAGYRIPAQIGFAARGYRLSRCGRQFDGSLWLAAGILSLGYLWNQVRVQGGAYGAGMQADRMGNLFSYSFRDPTPGRTLSVDAGAADFLRAFAREEGSLDKYIISGLNELNPLLSPKDQGAMADIRYLTGYTRQEAEKVRLQILHTTPEDLLRCADIFDSFAREGSVCVVAHNQALQDCGEDLSVTDL